MVALGDAAVPGSEGGELLGRRQQQEQDEVPQAGALGRMTKAVTLMRENVESGGFRLEPGVAERVLGALREQQDAVDLAVRRLGDLARPAPLGTNPVASAMAGKFWSRAAMDGDAVRPDAPAPKTDRSLANMLARYRRTLADAEEAVTNAMRQYQAQEDDHVASFRRIVK